MATGCAWSEHEQSELRRLWADGFSASEIAKNLRGRSRNAVIGMVHRLGLPHRNTVVSGPRPKKWTPARRQAQRYVARAVKAWKPPAPKPRKLGLPESDPSVRAAAALFAASDDAQRRRDNYRRAGVMIGGWA